MGTDTHERDRERERYRGKRMNVVEDVSKNDNFSSSYSSSFHGLGSLACSDSELTSETVNPFRHFARTPWMAGWRGLSPSQSLDLRGCIQKFPDWPPGSRIANGTPLCH
jgi:hypothetical protein